MQLFYFVQAPSHPSQFLFGFIKSEHLREQDILHSIVAGELDWRMVQKDNLTCDTFYLFHFLILGSFNTVLSTVVTWSVIFWL